MINFKHALFNGVDVECNENLKPNIEYCHNQDEYDILFKQWKGNLKVLEFASEVEKEQVVNILKRENSFNYSVSISFGIDVSGMVYEKDNLLYFKSSIKIIKNTNEQVTFEKGNDNEPWFNNDCSNKNLLKILGREKDIITKVKFDDGAHIGSILYVYFDKNDEKPMDEVERNERLFLLLVKLVQNKDLKSIELLETLVKNDTPAMIQSFNIIKESGNFNFDNVAPKPTWDVAFEEADKYAQKQDAKDREENNTQESGYWFWFKDCLKKRFVINRVGRIEGIDGI